MNMAQTRYRTLLSHLAQVFQAGDGERTGRLQAGLDDIVAKIDPQDAKTWQLVKADSERLLRVWAMREERALMEQILGALSDYATAEKEELPTLVISALPAPAPAPATAALAVAAPAPTPISSHVEESKDSKVDDSAEEAEEAEEADDEKINPPGCQVLNNLALMGSEAEEEDDAETEEEVEEAEAEDDNATAATEDGSVVEPDEEVEEEEDAADEEEGMEVDKVVIRGRSYWMDTKTKKLYAVIGDDDVGDEVGAIVNGKALFIG